MPYLPEDIIVHILSRLPVKSLLRFKCVSKPWRTIISDPKFANLHLKRITEHNADNINNDHHTFFITSRLPGFLSMNYNASSEFHHEKKERELEFPIMNPSGYSVGGSCNGLIFLFNSYDQMTIWNPTTRDYKVFSRPGSSRVSAFVGFGFDSSINDYKVVIGLYNGACYNDNSIKVKVFTLKNGTWRSVQDICDPGFGRYVGILANGALHWLQRPQTIMSFDLAQEQFRELVSLPYSIEERFFLSIQLGVLQGCLCLCHTTMDKKNEVWLMKEYGVSSSWSKLFSVSFETGIKYNYYFMTLCILKNGDVLMDLMEPIW